MSQEQGFLSFLPSRSVKFIYAMVEVAEVAEPESAQYGDSS